MVGVRVIAWVASIFCILAAYRWTYHRSRLLAGILAVGIVGRAVLGASLFAISAFNLPILRSLQIGGGFWALAIDAKYYFDSAAAAAQTGFGTISDAMPSPAYIRALAVWLRLIGISPASAVLFNLLCYVAVAVIIVAACRSAVGGPLALIAFTIDPALVVFGTQALKDSFCVVALLLSVAGMRLWCDGLDSSQHSPGRGGTGMLLIAVGIYLIAGIRPYVVVFILTGLLAAAVASLAAPQGPSRWRITLAYAVLLLSVGGAFGIGAGAANFQYYKSMVESVIFDPLAALADIDHVRAGFVSAGGATALADSSEGAADPTDFSFQSGIATRAGRLLRGAQVFLVPISVLRALSLVTFSGGRGLLSFADADTVVADILLVGCIFVLAKGRVPPAMIPLVAFVAVLSLLTAAMLAYVVTNFGTLFRLRMLAFCPIWLLPGIVRSTAARSVQ